MNTLPCPFCTLPTTRIWMQSQVAVAVFDGFPVTEGHTLIIPKKHVQSIFDLEEDQLTQVWTLVHQVRAELKKRLSVEAFNIGTNDGQAAGQTMPHAHIHIIPRRVGDVEDPRGGVRWIIPSKAKYWA